jgi:hypothetical protein
MRAKSTDCAKKICDLFVAPQVTIQVDAAAKLF